MAQERVSREELRCLHIGQTRIFQLTDRKKIASARVTCQQMKNEKKLEYKAVPDWEHNAVCITRLK